MCKTLKSLLAISAVCLILVGSVRAQKTNTKPVSPPAVTKLGNMNDTLQYAIGAFLAQWVNNQGFLINNPSLFIKGMDDVFLNKPRLVADSVIAPLITAYQQITSRDRALKLEQQLFTNIKQRPGLGILPNGVHYFILKSSQGLRPVYTDTVTIHLKGTLADGTPFEDTYNKKPMVTAVNELIPGVAEAIQLMTVGAKWQLYIPAALAFADKGTAVIPPNSALVLEVELLEIRKPAVTK
jgi:FKBP-type peptidyl-prolyl cis-trans isomerase